MLRRLFRIYGHIYASHFDQICALGIEGPSRTLFHRVGRPVIDAFLADLTSPSILLAAHLNTNYRHFLLFVTEVRSSLLECFHAKRVDQLS